jgi:hypothetical protein
MHHNAVSRIEPTPHGFCIYLKNGFEWPEPHRNARWLWFCNWGGAYSALLHVQSTKERKRLEKQRRREQRARHKEFIEMEKRKGREFRRDLEEMFLASYQGDS